MIYEKKLLQKKYKYKQITISDFSQAVDTEQNGQLQNYKNPISVFNFLTENGKLETSYGLQRLTIPTSEDDAEALLNPEYEKIGVEYTGVWVYKYYNTEKEKDDYDLILYANNGYMYWISLFDNDKTIYRLYEIVLTSKPTVINYRMHDRDYLLICNETEGMIAWNGVTIPKQIASAPNIRSVAVFKNRLFAITDDKFKLYYSKELDPTNWLITENSDSSGIIRFSDQMGDMNKIVEFLGNLYVIRDNGITKVSYYEDDDSYKLSHMFFSGSKIYGESVVVCERDLYFMTRDGIFVFDGVSTEQVNLNINSLFGLDNLEGAKAVFHKNNYYLACRLNYNDNSFFADESAVNGCVNNTILQLNTKTKQFNLIRGIDAIDIMSLQVGRISKLVILTRGGKANCVSELVCNGSHYDIPLLKVWKVDKSCIVNFDEVKLIKNFVISTEYDVDVKIKTDMQEKYFFVKGSTSPQKIIANLKGKVIEFEIRSYTEKANITLFSLEVMYD